MNALEEREKLLSTMEHSLIAAGMYVHPDDVAPVTTPPKVQVAAPIQQEGEEPVYSHDTAMVVLQGAWGASEELIKLVKHYLSQIDKLMPPEIQTKDYEFSLSSFEVEGEGKVVQRDLYLDFLALPANVPLEEGALVMPLANGQIQFVLNDKHNKIIDVAECVFSSLDYGVPQISIDL